MRGVCNISSKFTLRIIYAIRSKNLTEEKQKDILSIYISRQKRIFPTDRYDNKMKICFPHIATFSTLTIIILTVFFPSVGVLSRKVVSSSPQIYKPHEWQVAE